MNKQKVLDFINSAIADEHGTTLGMSDNFAESGIDSLGTVMCIIAIDNKFNVLKDKPEGADEFEYLDIDNLTVRDLVKKCISSSTEHCTEQNIEKGTTQ